MLRNIHRIGHLSHLRRHRLGCSKIFITHRPSAYPPIRPSPVRRRPSSTCTAPRAAPPHMHRPSPNRPTTLSRRARWMVRYVSNTGYEYKYRLECVQRITAVYGLATIQGVSRLAATREHGPRDCSEQGAATAAHGSAAIAERAGPARGGERPLRYLLPVAAADSAVLRAAAPGAVPRSCRFQAHRAVSRAEALPSRARQGWCSQ